MENERIEEILEQEHNVKMPSNVFQNGIMAVYKVVIDETPSYFVASKTHLAKIDVEKFDFYDVDVTNVTHKHIHLSRENPIEEGTLEKKLEISKWIPYGGKTFNIDYTRKGHYCSPDPFIQRGHKYFSDVSEINGSENTVTITVSKNFAKIEEVSNKKDSWGESGYSKLQAECIIEAIETLADTTISYIPKRDNFATTGHFQEEILKLAPGLLKPLIPYFEEKKK